MNGLEYLRSLLERLFPFLFDGRTLAVVLWAGLGVLTVSLLVLTRTRWGQAKPLSKCVALSVFAHLLFMGYAYGTKLFLDTPPVLSEEVVNLTFVASSQDERVDDQPDQDIKPWDEFVTEANVQPEFMGISRLNVDAPQVPQEDRSSEGPVVATGPPSDVLPTAEPPRPTAELPQAVAQRVTSPAAEAATMDAPVPRRPNDVRPVVPEGQELQRIEPTQVTASTPRSAVSADLPSELFEIGSRLQQLAELPVKADTAEAVAGNIDDVAQATNKDNGDRDSTGAERPDQVASDPPSDLAAVNPRESGPPPDTVVPPPNVRQPDVTNPAPPSDAVAIPRRLGDGEFLPELYRLRLAGDRLRLAELHGGNARTEAAVNAALAWLAAHQNPDGRWDCDAYGGGIETQVAGHNRGGAGAEADTGITGLALLALMGAGHTHLEGRFRKHVQHGLEYLLRSQAANGNLAGRARLFAQMYCHGMASLALSEAFAITGDHRLKPYVERAAQYAIESQHPTSGGWRYQPGDQGDMSQFGWQVMALKSAELAGVQIPGRTRAGMLRFLRSASGGRHGGLASYRPGDRPTATMTAEAVTCRYFLEVQWDPAAQSEARTLLAQELPRPGTANLYYWYYGTLAMFQVSDGNWDRWNEALQQQLLSTQQTEGDLAGSWNSDTVWGRYGGRVYSTAMAALCLEVYYRYLPLYEQSTP